MANQNIAEKFIIPKGCRIIRADYNQKAQEGKRWRLIIEHPDGTQETIYAPGNLSEGMRNYRIDRDARPVQPKEQCACEFAEKKPISEDIVKTSDIPNTDEKTQITELVQSKKQTVHTSSQLDDELQRKLEELFPNSEKKSTTNPALEKYKKYKKTGGELNQKEYEAVLVYMSGPKELHIASKLIKKAICGTAPEEINVIAAKIVGVIGLENKYFTKKDPVEVGFWLISEATAISESEK